MRKSAPICFVCKKPLTNEDYTMNEEVFLTVCSDCKGSEEEKKQVEAYLDSLADGFVCGCI